MIGVRSAHIGGFPVEEALAAYGPALFLAVGVASARLSARCRGLRGRPRVRHAQARPRSDPTS